ncbi:MAG TPA: DUF4159 domain-containing protein [Planctomycetota bacterium]|nr:DUF4159 domain-containing protein [Planctomycetota bacterium]
MRRLAAAAALVLCLSGLAGAQEVPPEEIRTAIGRGVERILACQEDDGGFVISESHFKQYPSGSTALALMALQYARPHLTGDLRVRTFEAIRKGLAFLTQHIPEPRTYSAGFILCALYNENPKRYRKLIDFTAAMLCLSQHDEKTPQHFGMWGYRLKVLGPQGVTGTVDNWGDKSNTQIALLGLYHAQRCDFQVPKIIWKRARAHYHRAQFLDGGWGYCEKLRPDPYANMTIASCISLNLCNEMLVEKEVQCKAPPVDKHVEAGLKWIADNWKTGRIGADTYGLYALERLGILMGRANIGGHDWYNEGARELLGRGWRSMFGTPEVTACFGVMFLSRGLEPIVINKLERRDTDDWNNTPYDVKHLVEYIEDHYQLPIQWRIVTLEAPKHILHHTPILHISGHKPLEFNDEEKRKLKAYVDDGGTLLAQACCGMKPFDESFRALVKELFGGELRELPKTHRIYERMQIRGLAPSPKIEVFTLDKEQGRPAVIYLPYGIARSWHLGGERADSAYAVGTGIYFYVTIEAKRLHELTHPEKARPAPATPQPEPTPRPDTTPLPDPAAPRNEEEE